MIAGIMLPSIFLLPAAAQGVTPGPPDSTRRPIAPPPTRPTPRPIPGLDNHTQDLANDHLQFVELQLRRLQTGAILNRGAMVQLAPTHNRPPSAAQPPNVMARVPSEIISWYDAGINLPAAMRTRVRVDVYDGPQGRGYVIIAELEQNGSIFARAINVGPEERRGHDWRAVGR